MYGRGMRSKQTIVFTVAAWQGPWWLLSHPVTLRQSWFCCWTTELSSGAQCPAELYGFVASMFMNPMGKL